MIDFGDKVVLVTGGGGGIGRAAAKAFARAGAKVAVVDIDRDLANGTVQAVQEQGGKAVAIYADVSSDEDVANYVKQTLAAYGRIDVFLNNAGWEGVVKPIIEYPVETFDRLIAINLRGIFLGLKHVLPVMIAQKSGTIVNTSSAAGYIGFAGMSAYIASKHAVLGLTKTAALEVAKMGIRVNAVCPGPVNTRMMRSLEDGLAPGAGPAFQEQMAAGIPDGRYAEPEEVANLMLYLASDLSSHITGQGHRIDGGFFMQ